MFSKKDIKLGVYARFEHMLHLQLTGLLFLFLISIERLVIPSLTQSALKH